MRVCRLVLNFTHVISNQKPPATETHIGCNGHLLVLDFRELPFLSCSLLFSDNFFFLWGNSSPDRLRDGNVIQCGQNRSSFPNFTSLPAMLRLWWRKLKLSMAVLSHSLLTVSFPREKVSLTEKTTQEKSNPSSVREMERWRLRVFGPSHAWTSV